MVSIARRSQKGLLSEKDYRSITAQTPVACVDILPIMIDHDTGLVAQVGLIKRVFQDREVWCHLGGRVLLDEHLDHAALRHVNATIGDLPESAQLSREPFFTNQFFRRREQGFGFDPSKHAIATCYTLTMPSRAVVTVSEEGEALAFQWFPRECLPAGDLWPGTAEMVAALPEYNLALVYESLHADYVSHNELMWQTPALAMTAMAFLLTIALSDAPTIARVLAGGLSAFTAVAGAQLFAKHSANQLAKADQLWHYEKRLQMPQLHKKSEPEFRAAERLTERLGRWFRHPIDSLEKRLARYRSRGLWFVALILFAAVSVAAVVVALLP
ncbi:MAG: NUDIX hydrolase family protein [Propionibacteriaceae bacterium]|jgi:ADP-ribose pyrophosphatase YjhB (NUDIX family)|nr:NUDIX hydrolase family protein [Propionibacteriaceae bacterium]